MIYEEALYFMTHNGATLDQETVSYQMMVEAMEKQIPKKPNAYHTRFFGDDRMAYDCPNCKHCFTMMKADYNDNIARNQYCDICGQAINWNGVE